MDSTGLVTPFVTVPAPADPEEGWAFPVDDTLEHQGAWAPCERRPVLDPLASGLLRTEPRP
jgi:hypothetical protein